MSPPALSGRLIRTLALAAYVAGVCLPDDAFASGSWAVPRFTPTWAELERDLKLLGAKRPVKRRVTPKPQAVAAVNPPGTTGPVDGAAAAASAGTAATPSSGGLELGIVSFLVNTLGVPLGIFPYDPMSIACRCPVPGGQAPEPAHADGPADQKPPDQAGGPPPDGAQKPAVDTTKKQKKKPVDSKKLDRKKYWWQEDQ